MISSRIVAAFHRNVYHEPNSGCWLWGGTLTAEGYGLHGRGESAPRIAHRLSYAIHKGPIQHDAVVRHRCDVRACVNPDHLDTGTQADNMRDAVERGRTCRGDEHRALHPYERRARGEAQGAARLTDDAVMLMRRAYAEGMSNAAVAAVFGVNKATARRAITGESWTHLGGSVGARSISEAKAVARLRKGYTAPLPGMEAPRMEQAGLVFPVESEPDDELCAIGMVSRMEARA